MKKFMLIAMVACMAIPAMAADISLTDNEDGTGTVKLTVAAGEDVRGLAIIVTVDTPSPATITLVAGVDAEFNVFMDEFYDNQSTYVIGPGNPVADIAGPGVGTLGSTIVLCMGKVDTTENQYAILNGAAGTIDVATITVSEACCVTIDGDTLRGGIAGDAVVAGTIAGGCITAPNPDCMMISHPAHTRWVTVGKPKCWCYEYQHAGDADGKLEFYWYPVSGNDLAILLADYLNPAGEPTTTDGICADFDHAVEFYWYAVSGNDLAILLANYLSPGGVADMPPNPNAAHYNFYEVPAP